MSDEPNTPSRGDGPQRMQLRGLHHVTAIVADLERTTAFYRDVLGLSLCEAGTNDDDPDARHFWFGDADATPGTLLSFMEYPQLDEARPGRGAIHHIALRVQSADEQLAWRDYLISSGVSCSEVFRRGRFTSIYFRDPDGHLIEIATG